MSADLWYVEDGRPKLKCIRCLECGTILFPPQHYGCEKCGAHGSQLADTSIDAEGTLHSFTIVHLHPSEPTPFQVCEIATSGLLVRARLRHANPSLDAPVVGVVGGADGNQLEFVAKGSDS